MLTALAKQDGTKVLTLFKQENVRQQFMQVLGEGRAGAFMAGIMNAVKKNPDLLNSDPDTVLLGGLAAASLELSLDSGLGFAGLVPFYNGKKKCYEAQFQIMKNGLMQLAIRTGQYQVFGATEMYAGEFQRLRQQMESVTNRGIAVDVTGLIIQQMESRDLFPEFKTGGITHYVAYFKLISGYAKHLLWSKEEVLEHGKNYSKTFGNEYGQWKKNTQMMCIKTVSKLLLKRYGLLSTQLEQALSADQAVVRGDGAYEYVDNPSADVIESESQDVTEAVDMSGEFPPSQVAPLQKALDAAGVQVKAGMLKGKKQDAELWALWKQYVLNDTAAPTAESVAEQFEGEVIEAGEETPPSEPEVDPALAQADMLAFEKPNESFSRAYEADRGKWEVMTLDRWATYLIDVDTERKRLNRLFRVAKELFTNNPDEMESFNGEAKAVVEAFKSGATIDKERMTLAVLRQENNQLEFALAAAKNGLEREELLKLLMDATQDPALLEEITKHAKDAGWLYGCAMAQGITTGLL